MAPIKHFCVFAALWHAGASVAISKSAQPEAVLVKHEHISNPFPARTTEGWQHILQTRGGNSNKASSQSKPGSSSPGSPAKDTQHGERTSSKRDRSRSPSSPSPIPRSGQPPRSPTSSDEKSRTERGRMPPPPPRTPRQVAGRPIQEIAMGYPVDSVIGKSWETIGQFPIRRYAQLKKPSTDSESDLNPRSALGWANAAPMQPLKRRGNVLSKPEISDDMEMLEALLTTDKEHDDLLQDSEGTAQHSHRDEDVDAQPAVSKSSNRSQYYTPISRKRRGKFAVPMLEKHELRMVLDSFKSPRIEPSAVTEEVYSKHSRVRDRQSDAAATSSDFDATNPDDHEDKENSNPQPPSYDSLFQRRDKVLLPRGASAGQEFPQRSPSPLRFVNDHRSIPANLIGQAGTQSLARDPVGEAALRDAARRARQANLYPPIDHRLVNGRLTPPPPPQRSPVHSATFYPPLRPSLRPGLLNGIIDHHLSSASSSRVQSPSRSP